MTVKKLIPLILLAAVSCGGKEKTAVEDTANVKVTPASLSCSADASVLELQVIAEGPFQAYCNDSWVSVSPSYSAETTATVTVEVDLNKDDTERSSEVVIKCGTHREKIPLVQAAPQMIVPEGYSLVWNDEFDGDTDEVSANNWKFEVMAPRTVNDERQRYIDGGRQDGVKTAYVEKGVLNIVAQKVEKEVWSARMNSLQSWLYGYVEARLWLPSGKGTWPAFWMMPSDQSSGWPRCGEIDIMEEVGYDPDVVASTIHCYLYNGSKGTQKSASRKTEGAEGSFHVYALEWTPDYIRTFVDGTELFRYDNDGLGNEETWPYDKPFYVILNLAWGGTWGGAQGVDESALPCTYKIDYVRVFQKS